MASSMTISDAKASRSTQALIRIHKHSNRQRRRVSRRDRGSRRTRCRTDRPRRPIRDLGGLPERIPARGWRCRRARSPLLPRVKHRRRSDRYAPGSSNPFSVPERAAAESTHAPFSPRPGELTLPVRRPEPFTSRPVTADQNASPIARSLTSTTILRSFPTAMAAVSFRVLDRHRDRDPMKMLAWLLLMVHAMTRRVFRSIAAFNANAPGPDGPGAFAALI